MFCIKTVFFDNVKVNEHTVALDIAGIFAPFGLMIPVILRGKHFNQSLRVLILDWKIPLPQDKDAYWLQFQDELGKIIILGKVAQRILKSIQLHVFSDASVEEFGAAAYFRDAKKYSRIIVRLLFAKSRVTPRNKQTLPILELWAAE